MKRMPRVVVLAVLTATVPVVLCAADAPANLPMPPTELQQRLLYDDFTISAAKATSSGVMGALKLELQFEHEPRTIYAKWKATRAGGDGWNNSPRREIGVYALQNFFLDPSDYLVPPVAARCIPLDIYRPLHDDAHPTFDGTRCVFGALSAWLQNVEEPDQAFDRDRFVKDYRYAHWFAQLNLLHYLADHRDSRASNFLMSTDPNDPRVFSIDNGIAFESFYNFFSWHYNVIRVPLQRESVERLRRVTRQDFDRLGVLGQLEIDPNGILRNVTPGANLDPEHGVRRGAWGIQFGLTREEIDAVAERVHDLLVRFDAGALPTF